MPAGSHTELGASKSVRSTDLILNVPTPFEKCKTANHWVPGGGKPEALKDRQRVRVLEDLSSHPALRALKREHIPGRPLSPDSRVVIYAHVDKEQAERK